MPQQLEPRSLSDNQFEALVRLMHRPSKATPAARLYLVNGVAKSEAARDTDTSRQALHNTLAAMAKKLEDARIVAGCASA